MKPEWIFAGLNLCCTGNGKQRWINSQEAKEKIIQLHLNSQYAFVLYKPLYYNDVYKKWSSNVSDSDFEIKDLSVSSSSAPSSVPVTLAK